LDTFQLAYRGFDPVEYVERLEADDRITHFHMKDWSGVGPGPGVDRSAQTRDLGEGVIDFRRIMKAIRKPQKYWYIVEREASPDPTVSAQTSYNYLANLTG
jgi:sugar phosphate isomerase/epimerase